MFTRKKKPLTCPSCHKHLYKIPDNHYNVLAFNTKTGRYELEYSDTQTFCPYCYRDLSKDTDIAYKNDGLR